MPLTAKDSFRRRLFDNEDGEEGGEEEVDEDGKRGEVEIS